MKFLLIFFFFLFSCFSVFSQVSTEGFYIEKKSGGEKWLISGKKMIEKHKIKEIKGIIIKIWRKSNFISVEGEDALYDGKEIRIKDGKIILWGKVLKGKEFQWKEGEGIIRLNSDFIIKSRDWNLKGEKGEIDLKEKIIRATGGVKWENG